MRAFLQALLEVFHRHREHELDPVQLIDFTGPRVIVNWGDVGRRVRASDFTNHAFAGNMIRQAGKGLQADNVIDAAVNQLDHLSGQEPAFPGLVGEGEVVLRVLGNFRDRLGSGKALAGF